MTVPAIRRLFVGSAASFLATATSVAAAIVVMPHLIHALGDAWYGAWVLIGALLGYFVILDFGVFSAAERQTSAAFARNDEAGVNRVLSTCFALYAGIGAAAAGAIAAAGALTPSFISDPVMARAAQLALWIAAADTALFFLSATFNSIIVARMRYDVAAWLSITKITLRSIAILVLVVEPPGLALLAAITFAANTAERAARAVLAFRLYPRLRISPRLFSGAEARSLYGFGLKSFFIETADVARRQLDIVIIGAALGAAPITRFNIAARLSSYLGQLGGNALGVTLPLFAGHAARGADRTLARDFLLASRIAGVFASLLAGGAIVLAAPAIDLWIGPDYRSAALLFWVLAPPLALELAQTPSTTLLMARNRHGALAVLGWAEAGVNLALSLALLPFFGLLGVALGTAIPMTISRGLIQPMLTAKAGGVAAASIFANGVGAALAAAALQAPIAFYAFREQSLRQFGVDDLALVGVVYGLILGVAWLLLFKKRERVMLTRLLRLARKS